MRDLEQCRAEVFRRSEEKIQERTRMRRRVMTMCVPLALCLVIGAVAAPTLLRDGRGNTPVRQEVGVDSEKSAAPEEYGLSSGDDAAALLRSYAPVEADVAIPETQAPIPNTTGRPKDCVTTDETVYGDDGGNAPAEERRVTVTTPEGEVVYVVSGDLLRCETEGWERRLTEEEAEELYEALDAPAEDGR